MKVQLQVNPRVARLENASNQESFGLFSDPLNLSAPSCPTEAPHPTIERIGRDEALRVSASFVSKPHGRIMGKR